MTMETSSGVTAVLVMNGHSARQERTARYHGTRGSVIATFGSHPAIEFTDHLGGATTRIPIPAADGGHGGGDAGLIDAFLDTVNTRQSSKTLYRNLVREPPARLRRGAVATHGHNG